MNLSAAIADYFLINYTLAPKTTSIYREHLGRLLNFAGDVELDQIDHRRLSEFMSSLKKQSGKPLSPASLDQIYRSLKTFFQFCTNEKLTEENPMKRVKRPRLEVGNKPRLTLEQIKKLLEQIEETVLAERNRAIILLMVDSGLRLNEVVGLRAVDVRLDENVVSVLSKKTLKRREVPISATTKDSLMAYLTTRPAFKSTAESFFLGLTCGAVHQLMKRLQKRLKFPLHAHLLRHTFANTYLKRGEIRRLQKILGHSTINTTAKFYTDPEMKDLIREHGQASPVAQIS